MKTLELDRYSHQLTLPMLELLSKDLSGMELIQQVFSYLAKVKQEFRSVNLYNKADFPSGLAREDYDINLCQANKEQVIEILNGGWLDDGLSLILQGGPGLGKSLLAIHLGISAVAKGYSTLFFNASDFFYKLKKHKDNYGEVIKGELFKCKLLIIDDIGHNPQEDLEISNLFYRLVDYRDSHGLSIIYTSNQEPANWIQCIKGPEETQYAALDRVLHNTIVVRHINKTGSLRILKFKDLNPQLDVNV